MATFTKVTLQFGNDYSYLFMVMDEEGWFLDFSSQRIFEEPDKGMLAAL